jgi:hypothetical protein
MRHFRAAFKSLDMIWHTIFKALSKALMLKSQRKSRKSSQRKQESDIVEGGLHTVEGHKSAGQ